MEKSGGDLLSQGASPQVPSALAGLTSVFGMGTGVTPPLWPPETCFQSRVSPQDFHSEHERVCSQALGRLVPVGYTHCCAYTSGLSTWSSGHGPYLVNPVGDLILQRASHLDAFSAYPFRRSLSSGAPGGTTATRELRPSRSSRTRDSLPQVSYGCTG